MEDLDKAEFDYVALAHGVISQAIDDVTSNDYRGKGNGGPSWEEVKDAFNFLTSEREDFAYDRELWCGIAGVDPDKLRLMVLKTIKEKTVLRRSDFSEG